jgi:exosortase A-associated hydrolase 2
LDIIEEAFYIPVDGGQCLAVHRAPEHGAARAVILHLPAFGDEMNKARAMTARAARSLARVGCAVLQVDWLGCGDSSGDHGDATLSRWVENAHAALAWLDRRYPRCSVRGFWALRAGSLLIAPLASTLPEALIVLWQPIISGAQQLNQLLRVKAAGAVTSATEQASSKALRTLLRAGKTLEIGGYEISPALASELEAAVFHWPAGHRGPVTWFEVSPSARGLSDSATRLLERARLAGIGAYGSAISGPSFWQSVEIERCDRLIAETSATIAELLHEHAGAAAVL